MHIPCPTQHTSAILTSQKQGCRHTPLAEDKDGLEMQDAEEYCSLMHNWELYQQKTYNAFADTWAKHTDKCKDGKKTQQS